MEEEEEDIADNEDNNSCMEELWNEYQSEKEKEVSLYYYSKLYQLEFYYLSL